MPTTTLSTPNFDDLLVKAGSALDIPDHVYEDATLKYEDVGNWLGAEDSDLLGYSPDMYVQGSFRLGTVVRPITDVDEYDIDLVCKLDIGKEQTTQEALKKLVGDRLKLREDLGKILSPSRRCWVLDYPAEDSIPRFHMDVLPTIPNEERTPTGILLTDTELRHWQWSNPKAYADWFHERMKVIYQQKRAALAETIKAKLEDVPEWQVKTPLQTAVQILKRHRDTHFQGRDDVRPISIIITTLAARAYRNQPDVYDALTGIVRDIEANWGKIDYVENRNGTWWVANPVDDRENFADKWNEYPERREAFMEWVKKVRVDITSAANKRTLIESVDALSPVLGRRTMIKASQDLGLSENTGLVRASSPIQVPALGDTGHCQRPLWPLQLSYKANVTGSVRLKKFSGKNLWELTNRSVPKGVWLRFAVATNVPPPFEVKWQIVNTGREAFEADELRGDFEDGNSNIDGVRWESTGFAGTHWVEAFIIKNGTCVARTGRKHVKVR